MDAEMKQILSETKTLVYVVVSYTDSEVYGVFLDTESAEKAQLRNPDTFVIVSELHDGKEDIVVFDKRQMFRAIDAT